MPQSEWWRLDLMSFTHATPPPFFDFLPVSLYLSISSSPVLNSVSGASCYCWWKWLRSRVPPVHLQQGWCTGNCDNSNLPATRWDIWANLKRLIFVLRQHKMTLSCTKTPPPQSISHCFSIVHTCKGDTLCCFLWLLCSQTIIIKCTKGSCFCVILLFNFSN